MPHKKFIILVLSFVFLLLGAIPILADVPNVDNCLNTSCYIFTKGSTEPDADGSLEKSWVVDENFSIDSFVREVEAKVQDQPPGSKSTLYYYECESKTSCAKATKYSFEQGQEFSDVPVDPILKPPSSGVALPFSYLLIIGLGLAILLIGSGVILNHKVRQPKPR